MAKLSRKRIEKYIEKNEADIVRGYLAHGGIKDKRSKNITKADIKRAKNLFIKNVEKKMASNDALTTIEAARMASRSSQFNIYADISKENMKSALKKQGYNIQKRSLEYDADLGKFKITRGRYKNNIVEIVHIPGGYPSFILQLVELGL